MIRISIKSTNLKNLLKKPEKESIYLQVSYYYSFMLKKDCLLQKGNATFKSNNSKNNDVIWKRQLIIFHLKAQISSKPML